MVEYTNKELAIELSKALKEEKRLDKIREEINVLKEDLEYAEGKEKKNILSAIKRLEKKLK